MGNFKLKKKEGKKTKRKKGQYIVWALDLFRTHKIQKFYHGAMLTGHFHFCLRSTISVHKFRSKPLPLTLHPHNTHSLLAHPYA